jgi:DNA-binding response OmpR family regulator
LPKILIVEDEEITAFSLELFCQELGCTTLNSVSNYCDAMSSIHRDRPDLLICDIRLNGDKSGLDIALDAQERYGVATIFLTAHYNDEIFQQAKKINFYGYIIKPFKKNELKATIELALCQMDKDRDIKKRYIDIGRYTFDMQGSKLYDEKDEIHLGNKSKRLLYYLSKYRGETKSYKEILDYVYDGEDVSLDRLRHLLKRVRDTISKDSIEAIKGIGYRLK